MASMEIELKNLEGGVGEPKISFASKSSKGRTLCIATILLGILALSLLVALIFVLVKDNGSKESEKNTTDVTTSVPPETEVCYTESCNRTAQDLLDAMDMSVNPCEDFYSFGCGKWILSPVNKGYNVFQKNTKLILDKNQEYLDGIKEDDKNMPQSAKKLSKVLKVCSKQSTANISEYFDVIEKQLNFIGGWPMVTENWTLPNTKWTEYFPTLLSTLGNVPPIIAGVIPNPEDTAHNVFAIKCSSELIPTEDNNIAMTFGHEKRKSDGKDFLETFQMSEYLQSNHSSQLMNIFSMRGLKFVESVSDYKQEKEEFVKYLKNIEKPSEKEEVMTIEELNAITPTVDWVQFLNKSFRTLGKSTGPIKIQDKIVIYGKTLLFEVVKLFDNETFSMRLLTNIAVDAYLKKLLSPYSKRTSEFENNTIPSDQLKNDCLKAFGSTVKPILQYLDGKNRETRLLNETMIEYLFEAMEELVNELTRIDNETKEAVYRKLRAIVPFSGYPGWTQNLTQLDEYYKMLPDITENPLENLINIMLFDRMKNIQQLSVVNDRHSWPVNIGDGGSIGGAFYYSFLNQIIIEAGLQVEPFYSDKNPEYMNFGSIGMIVGHEITHAFDKKGSKRDYDGNLKDWWTNASKIEFESRMECLVKQYSKYEYAYNESSSPVMIDGENTLSENIADNGGIKAAFRAYKIWEKEHGSEKILPGFEEYSPYQLFFISFARAWCDAKSPEQMIVQHKKDKHSPDKFRVIGSLSNLKEFSDAFGCSEGSTMNPIEKCEVW